MRHSCALMKRLGCCLGSLTVVDEVWAEECNPFLFRPDFQFAKEQCDSKYLTQIDQYLTLRLHND